MIPIEAPVSITERTTISGVVLYVILVAACVGSASAIKIAMVFQHMDDRITALESAFARVEGRLK